MKSSRTRDLSATPITAMTEETLVAVITADRKAVAVYREYTLTTGSEAEMAETMNRRTLNEKIVSLAWKDDAFRKAFLADPKTQFEEKLGKKLPPGLKITAHAEDDNNLVFVIPEKPKAASELSEADLEKVAGGIDVVMTVFSAAITASFAAGAVNEIVKQTSGGKSGW